MSSLTNRAEQERQVLATVIVFLRDRAAATGRSPASFGDEARARFPGLPFGVLFEAECILLDEVENAWWDDLAKTIDGEIVHNALIVEKAV